VAELTAKERLQPALLDRLTDEAPEKNRGSVDLAMQGGQASAVTARRSDANDNRVLSRQQLRAAVLRDLGWLLNTTGMGELRDLTAFPLVRQSVLNFGVVDLTGRVASELDLAYFEDRVKQAICDFEPRILRENLQVVAITGSDVQAAHNTIFFEIIGDLWGQHMSERLFLKTEVDLEIGEIRVLDTRGG
jgi:type VI secretion system protein ImpF